MTPIQLLRETQRAVASQEMIDVHDELKDLGRKQKDVQAKFTADQDSLTSLESRQRLQEADVERMREREGVVKHVQMMEAARPIAAYRTARNSHREAKDKRQEAQTELTKLQDEIEPALRALNAKERYKDQIQTVMSERKTALLQAERHADSIDRKFQDGQDRHNQLGIEDNNERKSGKKYRDDIARLEQSIGNLQRQMQQQPSELDLQDYNDRLRDKRRSIQNAKDQITELKTEQLEATQRGREKNNQIQQANVGLEKLESQAGKQNSKLQRASRDTARLWDWVQRNRGEFEETVYGPPCVECSVKDSKYVDLIESLFQANNLLAFSVQTKKDFKKLSDAAASMRLSEIHIRTIQAGLDHFPPPPVGEELMQRYGFEGWALEYLNGPEVVLAMICAEIGLHKTGVAMRDTSSQQYDMLQSSEIAAWVTIKSSYRITRRREYGANATSTQVRGLRNAVMWTDQPVDTAAKRELQENIEGWGEEVAAIEAENRKIQTKILAYRDAIQTAAEEEKAISDEKAAKQKALGEFKALPTKLAAHEDKIAQAQESFSGIRERLREIRDKVDAVAAERAQLALDYADAVDASRVAHSSLYEAEVMLIEATSDYEILRDRNRSVKDLLETQERQVQELADETARIFRDAQNMARRCQGLLTSSTIDEETKAFFHSLPDTQTAEELEAEIDSEKARLELMQEGNGSVIKHFEARQKEIDSLSARLEEIRHALSELDSRIQELREQWEPELDSLVNKISTSFSFNMEQISCAGEVGVFKDDDFDQWAIHIRVKFRENEPLTTLDSHRQSGGERAVSTIFYLMSLQSLTKSPFRVVDEINQGMDPRNERLVHKRMVGIACGKSDIPTTRMVQHDGDNEDDGESDGKGGSQYFLITPKLLNNLTYERGMRVLCIASGEYMPADRGRVDFKGCVDLVRGLKAGGMRVAAAG
ncbi:structural maintenance of chromosomes protein 5, partial [Lecanoromycetidae sp. Uapishka_2]